MLASTGKRGQYKLGREGEKEWDRRRGMQYLELDAPDQNEKGEEEDF
jgi:hypothetical protein